jgi:hypothetical protein
MAKRKTKKVSVPVISSSDEAAAAIQSWYLSSPEYDPYDCPEISENHMERLQALVRKIWEDAYQSGRSDARSDAAVEAAEAEWFNG